MKRVFPTVARVMLMASFAEDASRMWIQWEDQRNYMNVFWGCGLFIGTLFVLISLVGQVVGCIMVVLRLKVDIACAMLTSVIFIQAIAYSEVFWTFDTILRNLALIGAVLLLAADARAEDRNLFAGVPSLGQNKHKTYLQLVGRILLSCMYITVLRFKPPLIMILQDLVGGVVMVLIAVGYRTKASAVTLAILLSILNLYENQWWTVPSDNPLFDFNYYKYDFFHMLSIIGGLLMVVHLGPGDVSMDEQKKKW